MDDFDVDDFKASGGKFITKEELRASGPQRKRITGVEKRDGFKDKSGRSVPELVLVFSDGRLTGLRASCNREVLRDAYGQRTSGWINQVVELFCDPTVRNPSGAKVGGLRVRVPENGAEPPAFTSDLEGDDEDAKTDDGIPF